MFARSAQTSVRPVPIPILALNALLIITQQLENATLSENAPQALCSMTMYACNAHLTANLANQAPNVPTAIKIST